MISVRFSRSTYHRHDTYLLDGRFLKHMYVHTHTYIYIYLRSDAIQFSSVGFSPRVTIIHHILKEFQLSLLFVPTFLLLFRFTKLSHHITSFLCVCVCDFIFCPHIYLCGWEYTRRIWHRSKKIEGLAACCSSALVGSPLTHSLCGNCLFTLRGEHKEKDIAS